MRNVTLALITLMSGSLLATGCQNEKAPATPSESAGEPSAASAGSAAANITAAKEIYTQRCVACHGETGLGDGAAAAALNPKPRSFQDASWQSSVTNAHIAKVIAEGGQAAGKSMMMPPNPDLAGKPAVIEGLVQIVRGFKK